MSQCGSDGSVGTKQEQEIMKKILNRARSQSLDDFLGRHQKKPNDDNEEGVIEWIGF